MGVLIQTFYGPQAALYVEELAKLRLQQLKSYPYLYDGSMEYEEQYLETLIESPENIIAMAFDHGRVVGAAAGLPLRYETLNIQQPFIDKGYDLHRIYYFGESIISPPYRGQGLGRAFFNTREERAKSLGWYDFVAFCGIERPAGHPLHDPNYQEPDEYWASLGFRRTDMICQINWKDINETEETPKSLRFWIKDIDNR